MAFELPDLPYAYNALEPHIDEETMKIHHDKHHAGYVSKLSKACEDNDLTGKSLRELISEVDSHPAAIRKNGGGHWNHTLFWEVMSPQGGGEPSGEVAEAINSTFGSFSDFKDQFTQAALNRFGSGWAWLVLKNGQLKIGSTPNQDNPLMNVAEIQGEPILGIDVWEHAYYLKYQNRRPDYVDAWWNVVNWDKVNELYRNGGFSF
ncbi:MAG: superoxide dismutase [Bacteroidetes bacterium SW_11_45_7]|nr:MAG: superoxide dismutase [Bacteroidetes bacterium SW_11_45_7]